MQELQNLNLKEKSENPKKQLIWAIKKRNSQEYRQKTGINGNNYKNSNGKNSSGKKGP